MRERRAQCVQVPVSCPRSPSHSTADGGDKQATENKGLVSRIGTTNKVANFGIGTLVLAVALGLSIAAHSDESCTESAGPAVAQEYVAQCLEVSPATHPPCNAHNPCRVILDEIRRGCALLGKNAPTTCRLYTVTP